MSGEEVRVGSEGVKEDPMIVDTFNATSSTDLIENQEEEAKLGQELITLAKGTSFSTEGILF
jgi:hypothetical protein